MDIEVKAILQKLSVLKSNVSLLASLVIVLIALLLFIPGKLLSKSLVETVKKQSIAIGNRIKREQPPASLQWQEVAKLEAAFARDANEVALKSLQSTQRELLSYEIFPSPNDTSSMLFMHFGRQFRKGVEGLLQSVNAKSCPTEAELKRGLESASGGVASRALGGRSRYLAATRYVGGRPLGGQGNIAETILDEICLGRAKSTLVYAGPESVTGYAFWEGYKYDVEFDEAVKDAWFYQLFYWAIEDVFMTIGRMNAGSKNVLEAPVKRLVNIGFEKKARGGGVFSQTRSLLMKRRKSRGVRVEERPGYVKTVKDGLVESCTGRVCDESIDVMHFTVTVMVKSDAVLPFIKELCSAKQHTFRGFFEELPEPQTFTHNQITVLESDFKAVDKADPKNEFYRYGDGAIVELDLVCEYIFNKKAYSAIRPPQVDAEPEEETKRPR